MTIFIIIKPCIYTEFIKFAMIVQSENWEYTGGDVMPCSLSEEERYRGTAEVVGPLLLVLIAMGEKIKKTIVFK